MLGTSSTGYGCRVVAAAAAVLLGVALVTSAARAQTEPCTREAFRKVVDDTGQALRRLHAEQWPKLAAGFRRLKELNGWSEEEHIDRAMGVAADSRSESLDLKSAELLARLDKLAEEAPADKADCARLADLEAAAIELKATVKAKTDHTLARLEVLAREKSKAPAEAAPAPASPTGPPALSKPSPPAPVAKAPPPAPKAPAKGWTTTTRETLPPPTPAPAPLPSPQPPVVRLPMPVQTDGFSVDEIREASRGFFGTLSSGLGSVIEHAFAQAGRPTGYVLGTEGGGAFIAGVRYGKGTLFTRGGKSREVYWHGPSIGYDFGASGAKVIFLVYNLRDELDIFAGFSGVEGSAYLVGGVGLTFVTDGRVVLAPIRSGIGLRLGASIGYIRFTPKATWNPF